MPDLAAALSRRLREAQAARLPSVAAGVARNGELRWTDAVGGADLEAGIEATPEFQYRIGSITKTFTAVAVMRLRDEGKLDLDDRLEQHLPGVALGAPTIRRLLAHLSGLQREAGEMFVTGEAPTIEEILESMSAYEQVLPAARAHHYSNLGFALLGEIVARTSGRPYTEYVDEHLLAPLALERTTWAPQEPAAQGYLVDEYTDTVRREPQIDSRGVAAMGQLWSTVGDLCRWGTFLAAGDERVLARETLDEMWFPQVLVDPDEWSRGWGLGLQLARRGTRVFGGHGGAMPGYLAGLFAHRGSGVVAAALTNAGTRGPMPLLAVELCEQVLELEPEPPREWRPQGGPPPEIVPLLGQWWAEGEPWIFTWHDGALQAQSPDAPPWSKPAVFEAIGEREYRVVAGRELGERLRVEDGYLVWAGYACTRDQRTFG